MSSVSEAAFGSSITNPMFFAVSDKKPKKPKQAQATDEEVQEAARLQAEILRRRRGRPSTIMTGPRGVEEEATTTKATLG